MTLQSKILPGRLEERLIKERVRFLMKIPNSKLQLAKLSSFSSIKISRLKTHPREGVNMQLRIVTHIVLENQGILLQPGPKGRISWLHSQVVGIPTINRENNSQEEQRGIPVRIHLLLETCLSLLKTVLMIWITPIIPRTPRRCQWNITRIWMKLSIVRTQRSRDKQTGHIMQRLIDCSIQMGSKSIHLHHQLNLEIREQMQHQGNFHPNNRMINLVNTYH